MHLGMLAENEMHYPAITTATIAIRYCCRDNVLVAQ